MKQIMWLLALALAGGVGYAVWHARRRWQERERAAEQRYASFMAEALGEAQRNRSQSRAPESGGPG